MIDLYVLKFILLCPKFNEYNLTVNFSKTFISDISLLLKFNYLNSLKFTFSKILISDISLVFKYNFLNSLNFTFSNTSILYIKL